MEYKDKIIIIESPNKIKKIQTITGANVFATVGHFMELKSIEVEKKFHAIFDYKEDSKKKSINQIINACRNKVVYIATDPDREGYAIGYMFYEKIKNLAKEIYRAEFHEITQSGIHKGMKEAILFVRSNTKLYDSFLARRVADQFIGYTLSPYLTQGLKLSSMQSAGRVKTPALGLIVKRTLEIERFNALPAYQKLSYQLQAKIMLGDQEVIAKHAKDNKTYQFEDQEQAKKALEHLLENLSYKALLMNITTQEIQEIPPKPFITSSLLKAGSSQLALSTKKVQEYAQKLFEAGLITYIRTDAETLSQEFLEKAESFYKSIYPNFYERRSYKAKNSQAEAHEAIRITHCHRFEDTQEFLNQAGMTDSQAQALYKLIFQRTLESQGKSAVYENTTIFFKIKTIDFVAHAKYLKFKGYLGLFDQEKSDDCLKSRIDTKYLVPNSSVPLSGVFLKEKIKSAPTPYMEADFISVLEKNGIGRPSTYANYIPELERKNHITITGSKRVIEPTPLGKSIVDFFQNDTKSHFILDVAFTKRNEEMLDKIVEGEVSYTEFMELIKDKLGVEIARLYDGRSVDNKAGEQNRKAPSPKTILFARDIANTLHLELPENYALDWKVCSEFIEKNKDIFYSKAKQ
ncbi:type IA DNA topoisomerase [Helicobacter suis]|uniref:type IA DNA topoisomerase n=1 Tax=Helicobacter suis TaxID=104628 RepID=UPI00248F8EE1|nr:type IA DNA topoisomerase [Helicobacter suis]